MTYCILCLKLKLEKINPFKIDIYCFRQNTTTVCKNINNGTHSISIKLSYIFLRLFGWNVLDHLSEAF